MIDAQRTTRTGSESVLLAVQAVEEDDDNVCAEEVGDLESNGSWIDEFKSLTSLALPLMCCSTSQYGMTATDQIMVGQLLGKSKFTAVALSGVIFEVMYYFLIGCGSALDTLASQAHGAGSHAVWLLWTKIAMICLSILCIPALVVLIFSPQIAKYGFHQDDDMADDVGRYCRLLIIGVPPLIWGTVLQKALQVRHVVHMATLITLVCFLLNIGFNLDLITRCSFTGAPIATSLTRWCFFILFMGFWCWYLRKDFFNINFNYKTVTGYDDVITSSGDVITQHDGVSKEGSSAKSQGSCADAELDVLMMHKRGEIEMVSRYVLDGAEERNAITTTTAAAATAPAAATLIPPLTITTVPAGSSMIGHDNHSFNIQHPQQQQPSSLYHHDSDGGIATGCTCDSAIDCSEMGIMTSCAGAEEAIGHCSLEASSIIDIPRHHHSASSLSPPPSPSPPPPPPPPRSLHTSELSSLLTSSTIVTTLEQQQIGADRVGGGAGAASARRPPGGWADCSDDVDVEEDEAAIAITLVEIRQFFALGWYGGCMVVMESLAFNVTTALAGWLGENEVAATSALLSVVAFIFFMGPLGMSIAVTVQVGNFLGAGKPFRAKFSSALGVTIVIVYMVIAGVILWLCKDKIGYIFTNDEQVVQMVSKIAPIGAINGVADSVQGVTGGILRGMGKQQRVLVHNLLGLWGVGVLLGYVLTFPLGLGLEGLWLGMVAGVLTTAVLNSLEVLRLDWKKESLQAQLMVKSLSASRDLNNTAPAY